MELTISFMAGLTELFVSTLRRLWIAFGFALMVIGLPAAFLPTHFGIALVMVGLIMALSALDLSDPPSAALGDRAGDLA
eukprot:gene14550-14673_t